MPDDLIGYEASSLTEIEAVLDGLENATAKQVYLATRDKDARALAAVAASRADAAGGGGVDVTDGSTSVSPATELRSAAVRDDGGGVAVLLPVVISDTEPAPGAGNFWLRTSDNGNSYQLYVRDNDDSAWLQCSAGVADDSFDGAPRQVGIYDANSNFVGLNVDLGSNLNAELIYATDTTLSRIRARQSGIRINWGGNTKSFDMQMNDTAWTLSGLPTSDPAVANALWNDAGTLKISAG